MHSSVVFCFCKVLKCFEVVPEKVHEPCKQFRISINRIRKSMTMSSEDECKAVLYYVPIVSRIGTDIQAALQDLDRFGGLLQSH